MKYTLTLFLLLFSALSYANINFEIDRSREGNGPDGQYVCYEDGFCETVSKSKFMRLCPNSEKPNKNYLYVYITEAYCEITY